MSEVNEKNRRRSDRVSLRVGIWTLEGISVLCIGGAGYEFGTSGPGGGNQGIAWALAIVALFFGGIARGLYGELRKAKRAAGMEVWTDT